MKVSQSILVSSSRIVNKDTEYEYISGSGSDSVLGVTILDDHLYVLGATQSALGGFTVLNGVNFGYGKFLFLAKYDLNGRNIWTKSLGDDYNLNADRISLDSAAEKLLVANNDQIKVFNLDGEEINSLVISVGGRLYGGYVDSVATYNANSIVVGGSTSREQAYSYQEDADQKGIVAKYKITGEREWEHIIDYRSSIYQDRVIAVETSTSGYTFAAGTAVPGSTGTDYFLVKLDKDGHKAWERFSGITGYDSPFDIAVGSDNSVYVVGYRENGIDTTGNAAFISKYLANGDHQWTKFLTSTHNNRAMSIEVAKNGYIYVAGDTSGSMEGQANLGQYDMFLAILSSDGMLKSLDLVGTDGSDGASSLAIASDGSVLIAGQTYGDLYGQINQSPNRTNGAIVKLQETVRSSKGYTLPGYMSNLILTGTAAINGTGNKLNNRLTGNSANNILDGKAGTDTMAGKLGNDTYIVDNTADKILEAVNAGTDAVKSSVSYALGSNIENMALTGINAINGTGNSLNNRLAGNSANNILHGKRGSDVILGHAGSDTLIGGLGLDILTGGKGADIFLYQSTLESGNNPASRDIITDFKGSKGDKIDLSSIDAFSELAGKQAFAYIGSSMFSGTQGEIRFASGILAINTGNDRVADMEISLNRVTYFSEEFLIL